MNVILTNVHDFYDLSFFHDFSRPGNDHFKIPWLFQVFHNPEYAPSIQIENNLNESRWLTGLGWRIGTWLVFLQHMSDFHSQHYLINWLYRADLYIF